MTQSAGRIQQLFKQYGRTAVGVHLAVYTASFAGRHMHSRLGTCSVAELCSSTILLPLLQACMLLLRGAWTPTNCSPSMACCQVHAYPQLCAGCRLTLLWHIAQSCDATHLQWLLCLGGHAPCASCSTKWAKWCSACHTVCQGCRSMGSIRCSALSCSTA